MPPARLASGSRTSAGDAKRAPSAGSAWARDTSPNTRSNSVEDHLTALDPREAAYRDTRAIRPDERLACVACVQGDVLINVPPEAQAHKQVVRKSASTRVIEVDPAVRQLYVEVDPAVVGDRRSDWERLQAALTDQWALRDVRWTRNVLHHSEKSCGRAIGLSTVTVWHDQDVIRVRPGYRGGSGRAGR